MNQIFLSLTIVLLSASTAQAKDWHGIVPLHSTRADVELLLGRPTMDRSDTVVYEYPLERASIEFSKGACDVEFSPWNVPRDVVLSIWVTPKLRHLNTADLNLNQKDYIKIWDKHRSQIVYYLNKREGIEYSVDEETHTVGLVKYLPSAADEPLRCPEAGSRLTETIKVAHYANISFAAERKILDRFAQKIIRYTSINYASARAYILAYGGERQTVSATSRAERAKRYLVKAKHIDANRIETVNAGYRKRPTIELYLVPPGGVVPLLGSPITPKRK